MCRLVYQQLPSGMHALPTTLRERLFPEQLLPKHVRLNDAVAPLPKYTELERVCRHSRRGNPHRVEAVRASPQIAPTPIGTEHVAPLTFRVLLADNLGEVLVCHRIVVFRPQVPISTQLTIQSMLDSHDFLLICLTKHLRGSIRLIYKNEMAIHLPTARNMQTDTLSI